MPFVRPDVANVLAMLAAQPGAQLKDMAPEDGRQMMRAMGQIMETPRGDLAVHQDLAIPAKDAAGRDFSIPARLYRSHTGSEAADVFVFYHGGGWVIGDLETHDSFCAHLARATGLSVVAVDYRLAPEHPFPAAVDDCLTATDWVAASPVELGHQVTGIIVAGDSAGGNLAAVVANERRATGQIKAQWLIYPGVDQTAAEGSMVEFADGYLLTRDSMEWFGNHYLGAQDRLDPRASPLHTESLAGVAPAVVFTCGLDPLRDQGRAYAGRLINAGVRVIYREAAGQIHGCITLRQALPSTQEDIAGCLNDLKALLA